MEKALLVFRSLGHGISDSFDPNLAYSHKIISHLLQIANVTILVTDTDGVDHYRASLNRFFDAEFNLICLSQIMKQRPRPTEFPLIDYRPFVDLSIQVYDYAKHGDYTLIIFDVLNAPGFIPIRAKRTGLALEETMLVSWLRNCHAFVAHQRLEAPNDFDPFLMKEQRDFAEKYCCEHSDLVFAHTDAILEWVLQRDWQIEPQRRVRLPDLEMLGDLKTAFKSTALPWTSGEPHSWQANNGPLVSICIAHYNDARNLRKLLSSIEQNNYPNFEVIVVDDGSTDSESLEILKSLASTHASKTWQFILKDHNEGPGPTRNTAVSRSKGELLIFMDSDNLATGTMISDLVKATNTSGADCVTCGAFLFEGDSTEPDPSRLVELWIPLGGDPKLGFYTNFIGDTNFCVKKSVFQELGGFSDVVGIPEDWDFLGRLVLAGFALDVAPKGLYYYRMRSGSRQLVTMSSHAMEILRERFLKFAGPQHDKFIHELLLSEISENERLRSSVWKLDRKVVQVALKLSRVLSEKNRLMAQQMTKSVFGNFKTVFSRASQILKHVKPRNRDKGEGIAAHAPFAQDCVQKTNFAVRELTDPELQDERGRFDLPLSRPIFGFLGNLSEQSRPLAFLKLAYWAQMSLDDSFFVMVGDGPLRDQVRISIAQYGLRNFKWMSDLESIRELCPLLAGLVATSHSEPVTQEMLQALAYGIPVLSTDCGPTTGILRTQGNWLVVEHDPEQKEFAHCFKNWKDNLGPYQQAAMEVAELQRNPIAVKR